jgi:hypothetical protein
LKVYSTIIPYLLLVSFYTGHILNFGQNKIDTINSSPYHGVAVPLVGAYDSEAYSYERFKESIERISKYSKRDIWPWIF